MASGLFQRMPPAALLAIRRVIVEKPASPVAMASLLAWVMLIPTRETRIRVVIRAAVRMTFRATERRENPPRLMPALPDLPELPGLDDCAWCRSEEHTSELQSLMRNSYAFFS